MSGNGYHQYVCVLLQQCNYKQVEHSQTGQAQSNYRKCFVTRATHLQQPCLSFLYRWVPAPIIPPPLTLARPQPQIVVDFRFSQCWAVAYTTDKQLGTAPEERS
jgi:hypothetical protein